MELSKNLYSFIPYEVNSLLNIDFIMLLTRSAAWCSWGFWGTKRIKGGRVKLEGGSSKGRLRGDGSGFGTAKTFK